ncbi:hypothetical protein EGW08_022813 [Elysia chlorotica]|uniref:Scavenger receptor class B member 1 n=1 Tax=Elysia chlorotica TaxID=188477 RepID=A0A3S1AQS2_ELYCH|nr:hypothetical protein EGW08_022813 [Elysia chlorotica]
MNFTKKRVAVITVLVLTCLISLTLRLTLDVIVKAVIDMELKEKLPLKNGSLAFHFWEKPPVPVDFKIYVFDIVNPDEILANSSVPVVMERGPYVYKLHLKKTDIKYHKENSTVQYRQKQQFVYDRESSVGPDTETFTTVNIPFLTVANIFQNEPIWLQALLDSYFRAENETAFMRRSVRDIWWGYEDPVLKQGSDIAKKFNISSPILTGKFGFYMDRNNTDDGLFSVFSGLDHNFKDYATIDLWNGMRSQNVWKSNFANRIMGSGDGSMQPPQITKDSSLSMFDTNLRRTLKLKFEKGTTYKGVDVLRFLVPYSEFDSAKDNPANAGFCLPDTQHCPPSGATNMSSVAYTAPLVASLPHFVGGDPYYQKQVRGMKPSQAKHQPYYEYHAITGVALNAAKRFQLNVKTQAYPDFETFKTMADAYVPVLWIDGIAIMDKPTMSLFRDQIQAPLNALVYVKIAMIVVPVLSVVSLVLLLLYWRKKDKKLNEPKEEEEQIIN